MGKIEVFVNSENPPKFSLAPQLAQDSADRPLVELWTELWAGSHMLGPQDASGWVIPSGASSSPTAEAAAAT